MVSLLHGFLFDGGCGFEEQSFVRSHFAEHDVRNGGFAASVGYKQMVGIFRLGRSIPFQAHEQ